MSDWVLVALNAVERGSKMGLTLSDLQLRVVSEELGMQGRGYLNPAWLDWFMVYPIGWTEIEPLETP